MVGTVLGKPECLPTSNTKLLEVFELYADCVGYVVCICGEGEEEEEEEEETVTGLGAMGTGYTLIGAIGGGVIERLTGLLASGLCFIICRHSSLLMVTIINSRTGAVHLPV